MDKSFLFETMLTDVVRYKATMVEGYSHAHGRQTPFNTSANTMLLDLALIPPPTTSPLAPRDVLERAAKP